MWKLFLDDERYPIDNNFKIARTYDDAVKLILEYGMPEYVSFDHDLGEELTGYDFAKCLIDYHLFNNKKWNVEYFVHSQNPIGKNNIIEIIERFKKFQLED
jgi:hypothetical protein